MEQYVYSELVCLDGTHDSKCYTKVSNMANIIHYGVVQRGSRGVVVRVFFAFFFFFQAEDGIRDLTVTGVQTCALPILGLDSGGPRAGPWMRIAVAPWKIPVAGAVGVSYALRPADASGLQAQWLVVDAGPRLRIPLGEIFSIEGGAGFALQFVHASVTQGPASDQASR